MEKKLLGTKQKLSELKNIHKRLHNKGDWKREDLRAIRLAELEIRYYKAKYELLKFNYGK